tara:strand:- start:144 stop:413 length:270 start_codon:yes stop_codon:yes gene_type:complete
MRALLLLALVLVVIGWLSLPDRSLQTPAADGNANEFRTGAPPLAEEGPPECRQALFSLAIGSDGEEIVQGPFESEACKAAKARLRAAGD